MPFALCFNGAFIELSASLNTLKNCVPAQNMCMCLGKSLLLVLITFIGFHVLANEKLDTPEEYKAKIVQALRNKNVDLATELTEQFVQYAKESNRPEMLANALHSLLIAGKVAFKQENMQKALQYFEQEIAKAKENALQQAQLNRKAILQNSIAGISIAIVSVFFLLYRRLLQRRANVRLAKQVKLCTQELEQNTQLLQAYKEMEIESLTDTLTGLKNRRYLEKLLPSDLTICNRTYQDWLMGKSNKPIESDIVLFVVDIDNFKQLNDQHGHAMGDLVLKEFASRIKKEFRQSDCVIRWGGEEFISVARFVNRKELPNIASRITLAINGRAFSLEDGKSTKLTCSIGFCCYPIVPDTLEVSSWETLFQIADRCLYSVKEKGKNSWLGVEYTKDIEAMNALTSTNTLNNVINNSRVAVKHPKNF